MKNVFAIIWFLIIRSKTTKLWSIRPSVRPSMRRVVRLSFRTNYVRFPTIGGLLVLLFVYTSFSNLKLGIFDVSCSSFFVPVRLLFRPYFRSSNSITWRCCRDDRDIWRPFVGPSVRPVVLPDDSVETIEIFEVRPSCIETTQVFGDETFSVSYTIKTCSTLDLLTVLFLSQKNSVHYCSHRMSIISIRTSSCWK